MGLKLYKMDARMTSDIQLITYGVFAPLSSYLLICFPALIE